MASITKNTVIDVLKTIPDPELGISIWDLGLIYSIDIKPKDKSIRILMTLTSMGCPLFSTIESAMRDGLIKIDGIESIVIDLTFEPAWTTDRMSADAKMKLGIM